ncbi:hypothetical protein HHK36_024408 [Tetracentron sinense]|uniref:BHLH domain-containing protein n=1 Tax=Tetracentron sinense TaxID=13715 RepID=A0A834YKY1_TETSI|nr:hypothetical protein HHK36_024408 [Tetracentron sinense]
MELPQPRPFGTEGKRPTHDFLSLHSHSSFQHQDPRPSQGYGCDIEFSSETEILFLLTGIYLKTHDFLQPLERVGKNSAEGENSGDKSTTEKAPPTTPPPCSSSSNSSVERLLPGGIGTYSISHISNLSQLVPKPETIIYTVAGASSTGKNGEVEKANSNCSSYRGGGFTLWEESVVKQKGTVVKDNAAQVITREPPEKLPERQLQAPFINRNTFSSLSSSKFQILRDLIPHSDQKRDKASFLLEVIDYIQFLQEKVHKYEGSYQGWSQEHTKLMPWRDNHGPIESFIDHSRGIKNGSGPGVAFVGKFDENNIDVNPTMLTNAQNPVESDLSTAAAYKAMEHHPGLTNKLVPMPMLLQSNMFTPVGRGGALAQPPQQPISDAENITSQPQSQSWQSRPCTTECPVTGDTKEQEGLTVEGGTISISSVYSQGLLNTLTQALQTSGVDLSQASISVQIDLGKRANSRPTATTFTPEDHEAPSSNRAMAHSRVASSGEDFDQAQKRLKTEKS